jgi:hypothetical protein
MVMIMIIICAEVPSRELQYSTRGSAVTLRCRDQCCSMDVVNAHYRLCRRQPVSSDRACIHSPPLLPRWAKHATAPHLSKMGAIMRSLSVNTNTYAQPPRYAVWKRRPSSPAGSKTIFDHQQTLSSKRVLGGCAVCDNAHDRATLHPVAGRCLGQLRQWQ